jgi:two-component system alkaline phosphatase synthesis response regulator PhoP
MTAERLLIVEDELHLAEVIGDNLEIEGYRVEIIGDGTQALASIRKSAPALVLLDVSLPGLDGFEVCHALREEGNQVPILFLTARSDNDDRVRGLALGGDDYLGKPFDLRELILRVAAILRRSAWIETQTPSSEELMLGDCRVDLRAFYLAKDGREIKLSTKETMILRCLAERSGEVVSRDEILNQVWGYDAFPTTRTIDNFIVRLRRLIEPDSRHPRYIHTIRGVGYRLTP